jgi:hypothetical protein
LREVKDPTLLRLTANIWRHGCQPYAPAALYPQDSLIFKDSGYSCLLEAESTPGPVRPEGLGQFKKSTFPGIFFKFWFVRLLALRPLLAYCASLG